MPEPEFTVEEKRAHMRAYLEAAVTAAWLRTCGPGGTPNDWIIPGQFLEIGEAGDSIEIEAYPYYEHRREDGTISGWTAHSPSEHHCWQWTLNLGWDDLSREAIDRLEDMGLGFDERHATFFVSGSHQEAPPITDALVAAIVAAVDAEAEQM